MDDYRYENEFLVFRRANESDDLFVISELIYNTDPYIYPFWFNNDIDEARKFLSKLLKCEGSLYNVNNFYVAVDKSNNHIVGVLCAIDKSTKLMYDYNDDKQINNNYKFTIENYVKPIEEYVSNIESDKHIYISNICVSDGLRGLKIGSKLLSCFIEQMEKGSKYETFELDCLLHNLRAKNLYHNMGFREIKEIVGFDGTDHSKVEVVNFLRKKGNHYEKDFIR